MYGNWQDDTYKRYVAKTNSFSFKWGTFCKFDGKMDWKNNYQLEKKKQEMFTVEKLKEKCFGSLHSFAIFTTKRIHI